MFVKKVIEHAGYTTDAQNHANEFQLQTRELVYRLNTRVVGYDICCIQVMAARYSKDGFQVLSQLSD